ncbi:2'-5' RNA ligase [Rhodanobacter sp. C03]|nr:2'-5' RNA ligase [Rhodanobacter sp. C03]
MPIPSIQREPTDGISFFFAVLPDEQARSGLAGVSERFRKSARMIGTPVGAHSYHLTLCPMGRPERMLPSLEAALLAAAGTVRASTFDVTLDSAMRFSAKDGRFPFVLCTDSVSGASVLKLRWAIADAQRRIGLSVSGVSSYLPHVALLHGHAIDAMQESITPICWTVREFVLIRSFFGQGHQEVVARWPLEPSVAARRLGVLDLADLPDLGELPAEDE